MPKKEKFSFQRVSINALTNFRQLHLDYTEDIVHGSIVLNNGVLSWPADPPVVVVAPVAPAAAAAQAKAAEVEPNYFGIYMKDAAL